MLYCLAQLSSEPVLRDEDMDFNNVGMGNGPCVDIVYSHLQQKVPGANDNPRLPNHTWGMTQIGRLTLQVNAISVYNVNKLFHKRFFPRDRLLSPLTHALLGALLHVKRIRLIRSQDLKVHVGGTVWRSRVLNCPQENYFCWRRIGSKFVLVW